MTWEWRALRPAEPDYEALFGSVTVATAALAVLATRAGELPAWGCAFKAVTGWPCITCGSTRAVLALLRGDLVAAFVANPLVTSVSVAALVAAPVALGVSFFDSPRLRVRLASGEQRALRGATVAACGLTWLFLIATGR